MFTELTPELLDLTVTETGGRMRGYLDDPGGCYLCVLCCTLRTPLEAP